ATTPTPQPNLRDSLALHVNGNQLVTAGGESVVLRGVTRDKSGFLCAADQGILHRPSDEKSVSRLLSWEINVVRVPLNGGCCLWPPGVDPAYSGVAYRFAISAYVDEATARGLYVIVDLHKSAPGNEINAHTFQYMPDADHSVTFWQQVAETFK